MTMTMSSKEVNGESTRKVETNFLTSTPSYFTKFANWDKFKVSSTSQKSIKLLSPQERIKRINALACRGILGDRPGIYIEDEEDDYLSSQLKFFADQPGRYSTEKIDSADKTEFGGSGSNAAGDENKTTTPSSTDQMAHNAGDSEEISAKSQNIQLPTRWNAKHDINLDVSEDGLTISTEHPVRNTKKITSLPSFGSTKSESAYYPIKADYPVKKEIPVYYFEVRVIKSVREDPGICVGFIRVTDLTETSIKSDLRGCEFDVWSYDGKEGKVSTRLNENRISKKCPAFTVGDVVGCGINFIRKSIFFTKNGILLGEALKIQDCGQYYYPTLSMTQWNKVSSNFGTTRPFVFDIDQYLESIKRSITEDIQMNNAFPFEMPGVIELDDDQDLKSFTNRLVENFFTLNGLQKSFQSFVRENKVGQPGDQRTSVDDENENYKPVMKFRAELRDAFYKEDIQKVKTITEELIPGCLEEPEFLDSRFHLKCMHLFSLVRDNQEDSAIKYANELINTPEFNKPFFYNDISNIMRFCFMKNSSQLTEFRVEYGNRIVQAMNSILNKVLPYRFGVTSETEIDRTFKTTEDLLEQKCQVKGETRMIDFLNDYLTL